MCHPELVSGSDEEMLKQVRHDRVGNKYRIERRLLMGLVSGIAMFFVIWWTVIFAVLPWGIRDAVGQNSEGLASGAPKVPQMKKKFMMTTIAAGVIWLIVNGLISFGIVDVRSLAYQLVHEEAERKGE